MSVIYDALNKLKKSKEGQRTQSKPDAPLESNVIIFDDLLKKHATATSLILGVIAVAIGCALYLFARYEVTPPLLTRASQENSVASPEKTASSPEPEQEQAMANNGDEIFVTHIKPNPIPAEPEDFPAEEPASAIASFAETEDTASAKPLDSPQPSQNSTTTRQQTHNTPAPAFVTSPPFNEDDLFVPEGNSVVPPPPRTQPRLKRTLIEPATVVEQNQGQQIITPIASSQRQDPPPIKKKTEQITDFSPVIHRLNIELHGAIRDGDNESGQEILTELEQLLGTNSPYVLNLKAFFQIKTEQIDAAHQTLCQILDTNKTDLDAGLNMIVVLCKQGELETARRNINSLLDYYPANPALLQIKRQVGE